MTGKRLSIDWKNENGSLKRTIEIAFVEGKPGHPVSATLLNPIQSDVEKYPNLTFKGNYSDNGKLELRLMNPERKSTALDMVLKVGSGGDVSGVWRFVVGIAISVGGDATGKCLNCGRTQSGWSKAAIFTALAIFLLWAAYSKAPPKPPPGPGKGVVDDPTDPWNDLKKTQR